MKISDPFCRVEKRTEKHYRVFCESMKAADVDSFQDLDAVVKRMRGNLLLMLGLMLGLMLFVTLVSFILFPPFAAIVAVGAVVMTLWLLITAIRVQGYVRRFRAQLGEESA